MRNFLLGDNVFLGQHLHRIDPLGVSFSDLENLSERPPSDQLQDLKVLGREVDLALSSMLHDRFSMRARRANIWPERPTLSAS